MAGDAAEAFFQAIVGQARLWRLLTAEHFTRERRSNATGASTTDPDARHRRVRIGHSSLAAGTP